MNIALIHDWLVTYAGAERVTEQILSCFPQADLFSLVDFLPASDRAFLKGKKVKTSFIQNLPFAKKKYRSYLPLMPLAIEQFDLSRYDLVISSSHAVAKGVITGPHQLHISYVHSPMRYAWDLQHQYLRESNLTKGLKGSFARWILHKMRLWDVRTAHGVDAFVANSRYIARRIEKVYRRSSCVIYPPVDTDFFEFSERKEDFYLTVSRMVPYKKIDLIVETFSQLPDKKLMVVGEGPDFKKIQGKAGKNIVFLKGLPRQEVKDLLARAKAFVFAAEEDFGIATVEAQSSGTPVIAYGRGGSLETVQGIFADECAQQADFTDRTGIFFPRQDVPSLKKAMECFETYQDRILSAACRRHAERFSIARFQREFKEFVEDAWNAFQESPRAQVNPGDGVGPPL